MRGRGLLAAAVGLWLAAFARDGVDRWIDATVLPPLSPAISQEVVDRNGVLLRAYTVEDGRWRLGVDGGQVDPFFIALLLDYEDKRFYQHHGVDPLALLRAVGQAVWKGQVVSGGSTLTMQVARLLEGSGTGRVAGKLRQIRLAFALERHLTKDQILQLYLLLAPYGGNIEGVRAASLAYFAKEPRRLTVAQAALLVALTDALGPAKLLQAMDRARMKTALPVGQPGLAVALGGIGVTLEDMVQLYATIARGGVVRPLTHTLGAPVTEGQRVMTRVAAWELGDILAGLAPPPGAPSNRLAYKTGTSYGHRDAWALGFDGKHVIGVWMGRADGTPVPGAFGADLAAPVLFEAFARLKPALAPQPPPPADTLMLANAQLPQPLRHFRSRDAAFAADAEAPEVAFPPDGAEVELLPEGLMVQVSGGTAPFTWLANGAPILGAQQDTTAMLPALGRGFITLSVIDAEGRSARTRVRLR